MLGNELRPNDDVERADGRIAPSARTHDAARSVDALARVLHASTCGRSSSRSFIVRIASGPSRIARSAVRWSQPTSPAMV